MAKHPQKLLGGKASTGKHDRPVRGNRLLRGVAKGPRDHGRGMAPNQGHHRRGKASADGDEPTQHLEDKLGVLLRVSMQIL